VTELVASLAIRKEEWGLKRSFAFIKRTEKEGGVGPRFVHASGRTGREKGGGKRVEPFPYRRRGRARKREKVSMGLREKKSRL